MPDVLDAGRLAALDAYDILDTAPERGFDDVVLLARNACDTPVALVSLVAGNRQWFKARIGFPECETDLNSSVCAHPRLTLDVQIAELTSYFGKKDDLQPTINNKRPLIILGG